MNEKYYEDLLAGFALDALDGQEQQATAEHLLECEKCRDECAELAEALHRCFGEGVLPIQPSPLLRTQILARFALEVGPLEASQATWIATAVNGAHPATVAPGDDDSTTRALPPRTPDDSFRAQSSGAADEPVATLHVAAPQGAMAIAPRLDRYRWAWAGTGITAAAAVVFAILFVNMKTQYDNEHGHLFASALAQGHVAMVLTGPAVAHNMSGEVLMPRDGTAGMLIVHGVPARSSGMNYTCWVQHNGRWTDYGALRPDASGLAMMVLSPNQNLHQAKVAITAERTARPAAPSGPMLLSARL